MLVRLTLLRSRDSRCVRRPDAYYSVAFPRFAFETKAYETMDPGTGVSHGNRAMSSPGCDLSRDQKDTFDETKTRGGGQGKTASSTMSHVLPTSFQLLRFSSTSYGSGDLSKILR